MVGLLFAAPSSPGADTWPMTFRGRWEVTNPWAEKEQMILEKDGTIIIRRSILDKNGDPQPVEFRGKWYVKHYNKTAYDPAASYFFYKVRSETAGPEEGTWHVKTLKSKDEILMRTIPRPNNPAKDIIFRRYK
jgi:hypothetical protein